MANYLRKIFMYILLLSVFWQENVAWQKFHRFKVKVVRTTRRPRQTTVPHWSEEISIQPRVIGGRPAKFGEAPYHVRITKNKHLHCGGAIVNYHGLISVVTAGHCLWHGARNITHIEVSTLDPGSLEVVGADLDLHHWSKREQWFGTNLAWIHPQYDPRYLNHDIGILFLDRYVFESLGLEHVPLAQPDWADPQYITIVGHGGKLRNVANPLLQILELETVDPEICAGYLRFQGKWADLNPNVNLDGQLCMKHPDRWITEGTCSGDSGGPCVGYNYTTQTWYLAGVHSWSSLQACGHPQAISIATKVAPYSEWIISTIKTILDLHGTGNQYTNGTPEVHWTGYN